jgi:ElaB/YqjD/DUF883 family membrane-anchored ribosome-binding protein
MMDEHRPKGTDSTENTAKAASAAPSNAKTTLEQSNGKPHESHRQAGEMPARANNAMGDAVEHVKTAAGEVLASLAENIGEQARDEAGRAAEALLRQTRRAGDRLSRYATAKPLTALLVAGAVGYGLAYLLRRSQRNPSRPRIGDVEHT